MISERHFEEFLAPYYRRLVPRLQELGAVILVDTDGDVTRMVPWLLREGSGRLAAGTAGGRRWDGLAKTIPAVMHGGHFDKMTMNKASRHAPRVRRACGR